MADYRTLSPAARAVRLAAINAEPGQTISAALRAAAECLKLEFPLSPEYTQWNSGYDTGIKDAYYQLISITKELENN